MKVTTRMKLTGREHDGRIESYGRLASGDPQVSVDIRAMGYAVTTLHMSPTEARDVAELLMRSAESAEEASDRALALNVAMKAALEEQPRRITGNARYSDLPEVIRQMYDESEISSINFNAATAHLNAGERVTVTFRGGLKGVWQFLGEPGMRRWERVS